MFSSDSLLSHIRMHVSYHVYAQKTAICALYVLNLYIDVFSCMYTTRSKMWVSIRITWCFPPTLCMVHVNHGSLLTHDYKSLLQNIVSFLGLFCNRDLCIRIHVKTWVSIRITWCFPPTLCMVHVTHGSLLTHDYRSLLQNIVSFLGLFCKRDLCIRIHVKTWVSIRITWCFPPTLCIVT